MRTILLIVLILLLIGSLPTWGYLPEGWQQQIWDKFHTVYPAPALLFYINHLGWEITKAEQVFQPAA